MSDVEISNDALALIGKTEINSLTDPEPAARRCRAALPRVLREMQARFDWQFNLAQRDLAALTAPSTMPGFRYAHTLPADYLRFSLLTSPNDAQSGTLLDATFSPVTSTDDLPTSLKLMKANFMADPVPFQVSGGKLHTNFTPVRLIYHRYTSETEGLPELFRAAVVAQLAARIVYPLTRDAGLTKDIRQTAAEAIMFAQDDEDKDELNTAPSGSDFLTARN